MRIQFIVISILSLSIPSIVRSEMDDSSSIGPRFHYETSYHPAGVKAEKPGFGRELPLYKEYEGSVKHKLPLAAESDQGLEKTIGNRKSVRSFTDRHIELGQIAHLLQSADGITHAYGNYAMRSAPSGGALYPIDIYVITTHVDTLPDGLYHFQVVDTSLALVKAGNFHNDIYHASFEQDCVKDASVIFVLTARFARSTKKYSDRGYRYTYMEAGSICQNIYLQATALGLGTVAVGAFNDGAVNKVLGIDGVEEASLLMMPIGFPEE